MNYGVYTYEVIDGTPARHFITYKTEQDPVTGNGFHLMTEAEAQTLADTITNPSITKMVLPLEPDQAITAF